MPKKFGTSYSYAALQELGGPPVSMVMMDGGPENDNSNVLKFVASRNFKRLIAQVDIHFSNSMVESLFRCLKSNFLDGEEIESTSDVEKKCSFYFTGHNDRIPKAIFRGQRREKCSLVCGQLPIDKSSKTVLRPQEWSGLRSIKRSLVRPAMTFLTK